MLIGKKVSVGTTAVDLLSGTGTDLEYVLILRVVGSLTAQLFIGDSAVTAATGFTLKADEDLKLRLHDDTVYAITGSGTQDIYVLAYTV